MRAEDQQLFAIVSNQAQQINLLAKAVSILSERVDTLQEEVAAPHRGISDVYMDSELSEATRKVKNFIDWSLTDE